MKRDNFFLHVVVLSITFIFIMLLSSNKIANFKPSYAYTVGACNSMSEELKDKLETGVEPLTYECFGAVGDGVTNDYEAIKKTHDFANQEYVENGLFLTVHGTSGKNYYLGNNSVGSIRVTTDVDFHSANFIVDDLGDGIDPGKALFRVVSPMQIDAGKAYLDYSKYTDLDCIDDSTKECVLNNDIINSEVWGRFSLTTSTTNLKPFVTSVLADTKNVDTKSMRYLKASQIWVVSVTNSNRNYIRQGNNANSGDFQTEDIIINSKTGDILSDVVWNYDDIVRIRIWPIPEKLVTIQNGNFTSWTNNIAFGEGGKKSSYVERNFQVFYSGNVLFKNINHFLNETKHPNNNGEQVNPNANGYDGFIRLSHASYVTLEDVNLTPHTYTKKTDGSDGYATYDLIFNQSLNLFFNRVGYACNGDDAQCYTDYMISTDRWGIIGSNGSKNVFIRDSKLSRIDSHRGIRNLYVENTTVGRRGFTLTGSGYFLGKNLIMDRPDNMITFRSDYGSTWNGTMVLDGVQYILAVNATDPTIINSNHVQQDFGYNTFFPDLYLKNITIDNQKYGSTKDVTLIHLNENAQSGSNKYGFKGAIRFAKVKYKSSGPTLSLFTDDFVSRDDNLKIGSYRGTSPVTIGYTDNDSSFKYAPSAANVNRMNDSSINTKFSLSNNSEVEGTIDNKIAEVTNALSQKETNSHMPAAQTGNFSLKSVNIQNGKYHLNETLSTDRTDYTVNVQKGTTSLTFSAEVNGDALSIVYPSVIHFTGDTTQIDVTINGIYNAQKVYHIVFNRNIDLKKATIPTESFCNDLTYNGTEQTLTKSPGEGYVFSNNKKSAAGTYLVNAVLLDGYQWSDETLTTKGFPCTIKKKKPVVNINVTEVSVPVGAKATYTVNANTKGKFKNFVTAPQMASVTPEMTLDLYANQNSTATVTGLAVGGTTIDVTFYPRDETNYQFVQISLPVKITKTAPVVKVATPPSSSYCKEVTFNGSEQTLTKAAEAGYHFENNKGTNAGEYNIRAILTNGYTWSDGSNGEKSLTCRIEKAAAPIIINPTNISIAVGGTAVFSEESPIAGRFSNTSSNASIAKASPEGTDDKKANEKVPVTVTGLGTGETTISVTFTPSDTTNYKSSNAQQVTVKVGGSGGSTGGGDNTGGGGTVGGTKVEIPKSADYCNKVSYNGAEQVLTKAAPESFDFVDNKKVDAGEYTIKAVLKQGFQWSDNTTTEKTIVCTLEKAKPIITINAPTKQVALSQTITFTESANIQGSFSNASTIASAISISNGERSEVMPENSPFTVTLSGLLKGSSVIKVTFNPVESKNWDIVTKSVHIMATDAVIENYEDSNGLFDYSSDKKYFIGNTFMYTATDINNKAIENSLKLPPNMAVDFKDGKLVLTNTTTNEEKSLELIHFQTDYKVQGDNIIIPEAMDADEFINSIQKSGVEVSVENLDGEDIVEGSLVNIVHNGQIIDTYIIKIKAPDPVKTGEEEEDDFLFGINPIFLAIGGLLIVVCVVVLIVSRKKKKTKFIQPDPNAGQPPYDPNQGQGPNMGPYFQ